MARSQSAQLKTAVNEREMPKKQRKANDISGEGCGGRDGGQVSGEWEEQQKIG